MKEPAASSSHRIIALLRIPGKAVTAFSGNQNDVHDTLPEPGDQESFLYAPFAEGMYPFFHLKEKLEVSQAITAIDEIEPFSSAPVVRPTVKTEYEGYATELLGNFQSGGLQKAVLSRVLNVPTPEHFSAAKMFERLCATYPNAAVHLFAIEGREIWLGSSPELLIRFSDKKLQTVSLAATRALNGLPADTIEWNEKEREEQEIVTRFIADILRQQRGIQHVEQTAPKSVAAGNVAHLKTLFSAQTDEAFSWTKLAKEIHPTPAICGWPRDLALKAIEASEKHDRMYYGGFFGTGKKDAAELYLNLRCMRVSKNTLQLFTGGGYTAASEIQSEWEETGHKAQTLLSVVENLQKLASS